MNGIKWIKSREDKKSNELFEASVSFTLFLPEKSRPTAIVGYHPIQSDPFVLHNTNDNDVNRKKATHTLLKQQQKKQQKIQRDEGLEVVGRKKQV